MFELDGPGVHAATVDSAKFLALASSYFDLLIKMAAGEGLSISFRGVAITEKCVALKLVPDNLEYAKELVDTSAVYLSGAQPPPGLGALIDEVRGALRQFPSDCRAKVLAGPWERPLFVPEAEHRPDNPAAIETMRASVLRVGGASPGARLKSALDGESFSVRLRKEQARGLAASLYRDVDVVIKAIRTAEGRIKECELLEFDPVSESLDPASALRDWFQPHVDFWDAVTDIPQTLGRRDRS